MIPKIITHTSILLACAAALSFSSDIKAQSGIDPRADSILKHMGEFLGGADGYSFHAEVSFDEFSYWDQEIQYGGSADIIISRPNGLHVAYDGDTRQSQVMFDGQTLVLHDLRTNLFAKLEAPGEIDQAIDLLFEQYGTSVPIADLLYADPYEALIESAGFGKVVGQHKVAGVATHHLAFSGEVLDWQIWIQEGEQPIPLQLVITYKQEPGSPQYRARFSGWDFESDLSVHDFEFTAPEGAGEMEFLPAPQVEAEQEAES